VANPNKVAGLVPVKYLGGADWDGRGRVYYIDSAEPNLLSVGDPMKLSGSGGAANGMPGVVQATAGATCVGVLLSVGTNPYGPYVNPADLTVTQAPASKAVNYYALIADDPNIIYEIQEGGVGSNLAVTNIGENADFVAAAAATGVRVSGFYLNNNAHDTTSTRNLKILRLVQRPDNVLGQYAKWEVLINNHSFRAGITGV
jgi:hypothetical protein